MRSLPLITHVVGARPNFMKAAPVIAAIANTGVAQRLIHTGQHYGSAMSDLFFQQLGLPAPDVHLGVGSGTHAEQTAAILTGVEKALVNDPPAIVVVYGDVNSTMAATLAAAKLNVPVAHVEAGLRSFDRTMPEEINRIVTDTLAALLFTPSRDGDENLTREGVAGQIHRVGNVMIDTLVRLLPKADAARVLESIGIGRSKPFVLVTLHRPSTVDVPETLNGIVESLGAIANDYPVIFPVHPRTRSRLSQKGMQTRNLHFMEPLGYMEFLALERDAHLVITDSGGVQEETTYLGVPCITVRDSTERPITVSNGTNVVVGRDANAMLAAARERLGKSRQSQAPVELWDGHTAERSAAILKTFVEKEIR